MATEIGYFEKRFDESYKRVMPNESARLDFFDLFYKHFFNASPDIPRYFQHTDMERQKQIISKAFYTLFSFYASHQTQGVLEKLAIRHDRAHLNIEPRLYDLWLESIIATVKILDQHCDEDTELAWRLVLTPGIVYMKFKYDKAESA